MAPRVAANTSSVRLTAAPAADSLSRAFLNSAISGAIPIPPLPLGGILHSEKAGLNQAG
jgi:hypothetical protein